MSCCGCYVRCDRSSLRMLSRRLCSRSGTVFIPFPHVCAADALHALVSANILCFAGSSPPELHSIARPLLGKSGTYRRLIFCYTVCPLAQWRPCSISSTRLVLRLHPAESGLSLDNTPGSACSAQAQFSIFHCTLNIYVSHASFVSSHWLLRHSIRVVVAAYLSSHVSPKDDKLLFTRLGMARQRKRRRGATEQPMPHVLPGVFPIERCIAIFQALQVCSVSMPFQLSRFDLGFVRRWGWKVPPKLRVWTKMGQLQHLICAVLSYWRSYSVWCSFAYSSTSAVVDFHWVSQDTLFACIFPSRITCALQVLYTLLVRCVVHTQNRANSSAMWTSARSNNLRRDSGLRSTFAFTFHLSDLEDCTYMQWYA